jgi:thioredoxin 1
MKAGLVVCALLVTTGGVAWLRSSRDDTNAPTGDAPASGANAAFATTPAKEGDLCPDPPTTGKTGDPPATGPASQPTTTAAAKKLPGVVDLGADKCKACKELAPILVQLRKEYEGRVTVEFIDVWKNPKAGEPYKFRVIPTQIFFDAEGKEVWRHEGFLPKTDFIAKFAELGVK